MDITYLGHSSFKIKTKTATIVTDPFDSKMVGLKYSGTEAEIVTVSHSHSDHNAIDKVSGIKKVFEGPGEYEVKGVSIIGYSSYHDKEEGAKRGKNTIFVFEADGLRFAHLGDLGHTLSDNLVDEMGSVDILMIPVGGVYTIGSREAVDVVNKVSPYFVVPMHFAVSGLDPKTFSGLEPVDTFLKESGLAVEKLAKFSIKKDDIIDDQASKIIVLETKQ